MSLCFTHPVGWKLSLQVRKGVPWGRGWGGERPHGRWLSQGSPPEAVFHGQSQTLAITVTLVTWVFKKLQRVPFYPFFNHQQLGPSG